MLERPDFWSRFAREDADVMQTETLWQTVSQYFAESIKPLHQVICFKLQIQKWSLERRTLASMRTVKRSEKDAHVA
jgi:hypothetical protein